MYQVNQVIQLGTFAKTMDVRVASAPFGSHILNSQVDVKDVDAYNVRCSFKPDKPGEFIITFGGGNPTSYHVAQKVTMRVRASSAQCLVTLFVANGVVVATTKSADGIDTPSMTNPCGTPSADYAVGATVVLAALAALVGLHLEQFDSAWGAFVEAWTAAVVAPPARVGEDSMAVGLLARGWNLE